MARAGFKECPVCAEEIRENAKMCRFCGAALTDEALPRIISLPPPPSSRPPFPQKKGRKAPVVSTGSAEQEDAGSAEQEDAGSGGRENAGSAEHENAVSADASELRRILDAHFERLDPDSTKRQRQKLEDFLRKSGDEYRFASVLFVDMTGYTAISESLSTEEVKELLDAFYEVCSLAVEFHNGFVVNFEGDACLAVFGAPVAYDRDAESGVRAALQIREQVRLFSLVQGTPVRVRQGIATGEILSSTTWKSGQGRFDVLGPSVNLAARIQSAASPDTILICPATHELVAGVFRFRRKRSRKFKNIGEPLTTYEVLEEKPENVWRRDFSIPFVGREKELEKISEAWEAFLSAGARGRGKTPGADGRGLAASGRGLAAGGRGLALVGPPGIGKSRLIHEFLRRQGDSVRVLHSDAAPHEARIPYGVWRGALSALWKGKPDESPEKAQARFERFLEERKLEAKAMIGLRTLLGFLGAWSGIRALDPSVLRRHILSDLFTLLDRVAAKKPVVLALDDLQWADTSSLELLAALVGSPGLERVFFFLSHRTAFDFTQPELASLPKIKLHELGERDRNDLFRRLASVEDLAPEVIATLSRQASGNPLYMVEVVRDLLAKLSELDTPLEGRELARKIEETIPTSLKGILQSRIDLLDQRQKLVLQCGAVLGQRFALHLIELFEIIRDGLLSKLYSLKGLEFLEDIRTPQDLEFIFKHHLIREASYQSLLKKQRQGFHRLIGERMEEVFHSRLEELYPVLAWHFDQGDDRERAIHYLHLAGDRATAQAATTDALEFYEGALKRLMQGDSSEADRARASAILKSKGRLHRIAGQNALAFESFEMGRRLLERAADGDAMANLAVETGLTYIQTSEYAKARHELEVGFENGAGESLRAMASNGLGYCAWGEGDYKEARRHYLTALELAAASKNLGIEDDARNNLALLDWKEGKLADALENLRISLRLSQKTGNRFGTALTLMNIGILEENMGRFRAARRHYGDALTLAEKIRYLQVQAATRSNLGNLCLVENRLAEAMEHNARSFELAGQAGDARSEAIALENLALGHIALMQYAEARECLRSARDLAKKIGDSERLLSLDLVEIEQLISELEGRSCAEPEGKNPAPEGGKPGAVVGPPSKAQWPEMLERLASARAALEPRGLLGELPRLLRLRVRALRGAGNEAEARVVLKEGLAVCAEQQNHAEELRLCRLEATTR